MQHKTISDMLSQ